MIKHKQDLDIVVEYNEHNENSRELINSSEIENNSNEFAAKFTARFKEDLHFETSTSDAKKRKSPNDQSTNNAKMIKVEPESRNDIKCDFCSFSTFERSDLVLHVQKEHLTIDSDDDENQIQCDFCDFVATGKSQIDQHVKTKHFKCDLCDFVGTEESYLNDHIQKKHVNKHYYSNSIVSKDRHNFKKSNYKCGNCDFETDCKEKKCYHKKICLKNLNLKNFKCSYCGEDFTKKEGLIEHMTSVHNKERHYFDFKCLYCEFSGDNSRSVTEHVELCHKKSTENKVVLNQQSAIENWGAVLISYTEKDGKEYENVSCSKCKEIFQTKNEAYSHYEAVCGKDIDTPFGVKRTSVCKLCQASFSKTEYLQIHMEQDCHRITKPGKNDSYKTVKEHSEIETIKFCDFNCNSSSLYLILF